MKTLILLALLAALGVAGCGPASDLEARIARLEAAIAGDQALDAEFALVLKRVLDGDKLVAILEDLDLVADYRLEGPRPVRNGGASTWWTPWRLIQLLPPQGIERTRWEGDI